MTDNINTKMHFAPMGTLAAASALALGVLASSPALAQSGAHDAPKDAVCIVNASEKEAFFAVETREGARKFSKLAPGEQLCSAATQEKDAIVSVFETDDGFEGCSHIVARGNSVDMFEYAEFDRCRWSDS